MKYIATVLCFALFGDPLLAAERARAASEVQLQTGIPWHTTPAGAAAAAEKEQKPILWFRHLGELSGPMCSASHRTRVVTLADPEVQREFGRGFVPLSTNLEGNSGAGHSVGHLPSDAPGMCPPRLAHQNCQIYFLTPKLEMFHAATGFLPANDLEREMQFAGKLFSDMRKKPREAEKLVVDAHRAYLKQQGFKNSDLALPADGFGKLLAASGMPGSFGNNKEVGDVFGDITRARVLRDNAYMVERPLISLAEFERDPSALLGIADFSFQSGPASGRPTGK